MIRWVQDSLNERLKRMYPANAIGGFSDGPHKPSGAEIERRWIDAWLTPERAKEILAFDGTWRELGEYAHWCWGAPYGDQNTGDNLQHSAWFMIYRRDGGQK